MLMSISVIKAFFSCCERPLMANQGCILDYVAPPSLHLPMSITMKLLNELSMHK